MVDEKRQFFLGVGAPRAGTTWLYRNIRGSTDLYLPPVKELRFFKGVRELDIKSIQADNTLQETDLTDEDRAFVEVWRNVKDGDGSRYIGMFPDRPKIGEISPIYSTLNRQEISTIRSVLEPYDVRVFYMLRNPFFRDVSHIIFAMHRQRNRKTPYSVAEYMDFIGGKLFMRRSNYQRNVRVWREAYESNFHVFYYDELDTEPAEFFGNFCEKLGLDFDPSKVIKTKVNQSGHANKFAISLPQEVLTSLKDRHEAAIPVSSGIPKRYKKKWLAEIEAYFTKDQ